MVLAHDILTTERTEDVRISENVSFDSMLLSSNTLKGLKTSGFYAPSPIQLHGIPMGKCGFDLLLEAKSGTGKTAVFTVIALEKLNLDKGVQTLILAPTREIASQICDVIKTIGAYYKGLCVEVVMGGLPFADDVEKFKKKVHIVVGSPGRLHYLIRGKHIDVSSARLLVLDEADKLVEKNFLTDINYIFSLLPSQKQIIMSSATYPDNTKTVMRKYVQNAHHICPDSSSVLLGIEQNVVIVQSHVNIVKQTKNRYQELHQILSKKQFKQCLVFCNYQARVGEVYKMLNKDKWPADKLYGKQEQTDRLEALKILQEYQCRILVSTDLAARGIDASNVDLVINFEIPYDWQTYLHRIGRAGRFGSYGIAITILCEGDEEMTFKKLLKSINIPFNLKYLWSKQPYVLNSPLLKNCTEGNYKEKEDKIQSEIKEPQQQQQLEEKESYTQLWKMLSFDPNITNEDAYYIPNFESLCYSFEQANEPDKDINIESFSDLLSSFQNYETNYDKLNYKTLEVNKLIVPIFDHKLILQSLLNNNSRMPSENAEINQKDVHTRLHSMNSFNSSSQVQVIPMNHCKLANAKKVCETTNGELFSDAKIICNEKQLNGTNHNIIVNGRSEHYQSETAHLNLSNISESSVCHSNSASKSNRESTSRQDGDRNILYSKILNEHKALMPNQDTINQANDEAYEYNGDMKSLLTYNLPTAFGKCKINNVQTKKLMNANISNSVNKINNVIKTPPKREQTYVSKTRGTQNVFLCDTLDIEKSEERVFYRSQNRKTYIGHGSFSKASKIYEANDKNRSGRSSQERQLRFDAWCRRLQAHVAAIRQTFYIDIMSSPI